MTKERLMELSSTIESGSASTTISISDIVKKVREHLRTKEQQKQHLNKQQMQQETLNWLNLNIHNYKIPEYTDREGRMNTQKITERVINEIFNYGCVQSAIEDEDIDEIRFNGKFIKVEKFGQIEDYKDEFGNEITFTTPEEQRVVLTKLSQGERLTPKDALVNGRTLEGYRIAMVDSSAITKLYDKDIDGYASAVLRKFKTEPITIEDEVMKYKSLSDGMARFLKPVANAQTFVTVGKTGSGKSVSYDTKIITPLGYRLAKDIKVGDMVYDGNGEKTTIIGVYPQGKLDVYRITFEDKTYVEVSLDHINRVYENKTEKKDMLTSELIEYYKKNNSFNHWIKRPMNIEHNQQEYAKIESIVKERYEECICFMVESPDHTYLVNDFIPTHNTTLNRAILDYIDNETRVIYAQNPAEIDLRRFDPVTKKQLNDVLMLDATIESGEKRTTSNTMENIMVHVLRLSPTIVGINEVRSPKEFHTLTQIALAGHKINTTFHAGDSKDAIIRYTNAFITESGESFDVAMMTITSAINFVIVQNKLADGKRKTMQISEIIGSDGNMPKWNDIYIFEPNGQVIKDNDGRIKEICGVHKKVGQLTEKTIKELLIAGYTRDEINELDYAPGSKEETYTGKNIR